MQHRNNIIATILLALGFFALRQSTQAVNPAPDGGYPGGNTAEGKNALLSLTTGAYNTAAGFFSLESNTAGSFNTAIGAGTLLANIGDNNTATGAGALLSNTSGSYNTANGLFALFSNTTGFDNTAIGDEPLFSNTTGVSNTAIGGEALLMNTEGSNNTATGRNALRENTTGHDNTAIGGMALENNTTGSSNIAIGSSAGSDLTTGDNNIDIGFNVVGLADESNTIRIGSTDITDTFIRGISGTTVASGAAVLVAANGHLGTITSSKRFKEGIKPMDKASEALFSLKPVTFRYKGQLDPAGTQQFGLVAEDVEEVNPDLVVRDEHGKVNSVRYDQVNAMLLNEFLKEHRTVVDLKKEIAALTATVREQALQIQKVSAQIAVNRSAPRTVANDR
jgi:Chaperone of endosialidase